MLVFLGEMTIWRHQEFYPRFGLELLSMNLYFSAAPKYCHSVCEGYSLNNTETPQMAQKFVVKWMLALWCKNYFKSLVLGLNLISGEF